MVRGWVSLVFAVVVFGANGCHASDDAKNFVEKVVRESLEVVNGKGSSDEKRARLSESVNKHLNVRWLAEKVFGQFGYRKLSDEDKTKVDEFLKNYLLRFYAGEGKLSAMMGAKMLPIGAKDVEKDGDKHKVKTKFKKGDGAQPLAIVWVVKDDSVLYVEIEGINQLITLRAEMKAAVGNKPLMDFIKNYHGKG